MVVHCNNHLYHPWFISSGDYYYYLLLLLLFFFEGIAEVLSKPIELQIFSRFCYLSVMFYVCLDIESFITYLL